MKKPIGSFFRKAFSFFPDYFRPGKWFKTNFVGTGGTHWTTHTTLFLLYRRCDIMIQLSAEQSIQLPDPDVFCGLQRCFGVAQDNTSDRLLHHSNLVVAFVGVVYKLLPI